MNRWANHSIYKKRLLHRLTYLNVILLAFASIWTLTTTTRTARSVCIGRVTLTEASGIPIATLATLATPTTAMKTRSCYRQQDKHNRYQQEQHLYWCVQVYHSKRFHCITCSNQSSPSRISFVAQIILRLLDNPRHVHPSTILYPYRFGAKAEVVF